MHNISHEVLGPKDQIKNLQYAKLGKGNMLQITLSQRTVNASDREDFELAGADVVGDLSTSFRDSIPSPGGKSGVFSTLTICPLMTSPSILSALDLVRHDGSSSTSRLEVRHKVFVRYYHLHAEIRAAIQVLNMDQSHQSQKRRTHLVVNELPQKT